MSAPGEAKPPKEAPPTYEQATGSSSASGVRRRVSRNGIPAVSRRSMEDETRPLPPGWVRQFDPKEKHQFFVDTNADPPRAIWHHPYDDEEYLSTLDPAEREAKSSLLKPPKSKVDLEAESTDDEADQVESTDTKTGAGPSGSARPARAGPSSSYLSPAAAKGKSSLGRKMKDKITGTTHEEREARRRQRAEEERKAYELHQKFRTAMARAMETGQPQLVGKDSQGKDVYVEPPSYGYGGARGYGSYGGNAYGYSPYNQGAYNQGPYANPNARFIRPQQPYQRPYGSGYGGGLALPLAGGLAGGLLLGGLLGGF